MYAVPKGRDAVAPWGLGADLAAAPSPSGRRLRRYEQSPDQLGSLPEPLLSRPALRWQVRSRSCPASAAPLRVRAGTDSRCDRSVDGRDLSPADTKLDRWTSSNAQHNSRPSWRLRPTVAKAIRRRAIIAQPSLGESARLQRRRKGAGGSRMGRGASKAA